MRFQRVLLASAPAVSRYGALRVPAGIGYIAQVLWDNDIEYDYLDMRIESSFRDLKKKALKFQPDLIGFSMSSLGYKKTYQVMTSIKELLPDCCLVVGGHHATILKEKVLEECNAVDFAVVSDGEKTILELCRDEVPIEKIEGLAWRNGGGRVSFNGERTPVKDLDEFAFPRYERFDLSRYSKQIPVNSSRGCPNQCTFCPNKLLARKYKARSADHFVGELEHWYEKGIRQFAIDDDNFTLDKQRVLRICDEIERRGLRDLLIRCSNGVRADRVNRELLSRMKEVGVREVGFGVDGGNNQVLKHLKKGETVETIDQSIKMACELGLDVKLFFLCGSPHEKASDIEDSIRLARKYPVARVNFNNPIPYPGTEMYDYVKENNLFLVPPEEYLNSVAENKTVPLFETPELPRKERIRILKKCHRVEREVMKNTVYRMFSRYPMLASIIRQLFIVRLFEKLFFQNLFLRNMFERIRYKKLLGR
ncbi:MAG: coproporphyrinogen III oxidase [Syntrophorhabdaceae bacterium PtaU1.Bin034]|nr:MAG: coproporphyrinogen III oxidase [Syntrophorhabdaceae bacterium PtaU1.Bin034]